MVSAPIVVSYNRASAAYGEDTNLTLKVPRADDICSKILLYGFGGLGATKDKLLSEKRGEYFLFS